MTAPFFPGGGGIFAPGGVGFWVFLLILALLGIAWASGASAI
jgi:hypothetical protein